MKYTINNIETIKGYKNLKGEGYISRFEQNNYASTFFHPYFELTHTNKVKDIKVIDRYNNEIKVRVLGKSNANDIQIYIVEHRNYNARKFKKEYKIYTASEIARLNLKRVEN